MDVKEMKSLMKKYGHKHYGKAGRITGADVICTVCGGKISFDGTEEIPEMEFVITKRRSALFVHSKCTGDVWNSKAHWKETE